MIQTILVANRGEIACRVIRTCRRLGIRSVAVYSDADARARHVRMADEAVHIGGSPSPESYLLGDVIIRAAQRTGADAVHPGVGFLAENAEFARACRAAGLVFIGPDAETIAALGNKHKARQSAERAGVRILPGYGGADQSDATLLWEAERIGWPVMLKAAAGGGGKGMRVLHGPAGFAEALAAARSEARQAFGSDELVLERALLAPRHVEFQIFGDRHGNLIHLGERECSIQRRHQKVIEEAPSPALTAELRSAMGAAAVAAARSAHYTNAGTVEFLLDADGQYYFLEINTRLQVEHPVTECVTGLDLVEWQIRIAEGEPLPLSQDAVKVTGHAIEARVYAENPAHDFLPTTGDIVLWREPAGEGVRVESGVETGNRVSIYYDPMLAKIIAYGPDRATASRRLSRALDSTSLLGLANNLSYAQAIIRHPGFAEGRLSTAFLGEHFAGWEEPAGDVRLACVAASVAEWTQHPRAGATAAYWRNNPNGPPSYRFGLASHADPVEVTLMPPHDGPIFHVTTSLEPEASFPVELNEQTEHDLWLTVDGHRQRIPFARNGETWWVQTRAGVVRLETIPRLPEPKPRADAGGSLRAPMPGSVRAVLVEAGQRVAKGDALMTLEAMKMELTIRTAAAGVVDAIYFAPGDTVDADALLVRIAEPAL